MLQEIVLHMAERSGQESANEEGGVKALENTEKLR